LNRRDERKTTEPTDAPAPAQEGVLLLPLDSLRSFSVRSNDFLVAFSAIRGQEETGISRVSGNQQSSVSGVFFLVFIFFYFFYQIN